MVLAFIIFSIYHHKEGFLLEKVYSRGKLVLLYVISGEKGGSYLQGYYFVHSLYSPSAGI